MELKKKSNWNQLKQMVVFLTFGSRTPPAHRKRLKDMLVQNYKEWCRIHHANTHKIAWRRACFKRGWSKRGVVAVLMISVVLLELCGDGCDFLWLLGIL